MTRIQCESAVPLHDLDEPRPDTLQAIAFALAKEAT
jgi:hypothetical protein